MRTDRPAIRLSLVLFLVLTGLASARGAWAQLTPGLYRGVENETGNVFLFRLELPPPQPESTPLVVGTILNLEAGTYRVVAGRTERGGLRNQYASLCSALDQAAAAHILAAPDSVLVTDPSGNLVVNPELLNPFNCCQVEPTYNAQGDLAYFCGRGGVLHPLRP
jgi:hypothetical protein